MKNKLIYIDNKLIDIISGGILLYILINMKEMLKGKGVYHVLKETNIETRIGMSTLLILLLTNIYYKRNYNKLSENTKHKSKALWNATLAGLISLIIAYFAYINKILPVFYFVFVMHYYLSIND